MPDLGQVWQKAFHLNNSKVLIFKIQIKFLDFKFIFRKLL